MARHKYIFMKQKKVCNKFLVFPFFWGAFESLSEMGFDGHENQFQLASELSLNDQQQSEAANPSTFSALSLVLDSGVLVPSILTVTFFQVLNPKSIVHLIVSTN